MPHTKPQSESLIELCAGVLPVWVRHLASSRAQSEAAVHMMLQAFAEMDPGLRQAQQNSAHASTGQPGSGSQRVDLSVALHALLSPHLKNPDDCASVVAGVLGAIRTSKQQGELASDAPSHSANGTAQPAESPVDRMYKGLQYQDRIAQMVVLLEEDMARMQKMIAAKGPQDTRLTEWLALLESKYAMAEQRSSHSAEGSGAAANNETTFF